jgi:serine/threonine protein kinase
MELIHGQTLSSLLAAGPLSPQAAVSVVDQLLDGVGYAHARGIVHRDIKPENVFVTDDGRVKLTDFGIAHAGAGTALTQAGTVMGTPGYMAPEQILGQPVDARADLFAIGVIFHEALTGQNPFLAGEPHPTTVMYRVLNEPLPDVRTAGSDAPRGANQTIATATEKDPARRFASAADMRSALRGESLPRAKATRERRRSSVRAGHSSVAEMHADISGDAGPGRSKTVRAKSERTMAGSRLVRNSIIGITALALLAAGVVFASRSGLAPEGVSAWTLSTEDERALLLAASPAFSSHLWSSSGYEAHSTAGSTQWVIVKLSHESAADRFVLLMRNPRPSGGWYAWRYVGYASSVRDVLSLSNECPEALMEFDWSVDDG